MEAKDTVMSRTQVNRIIEKKGSFIPAWAPYDVNHTDYQLCLAQAEITWDITKQAGFEIGIEQGIAEGRREVVEFIEDEFGYFMDDKLEKIIIEDGGYYGFKVAIDKYKAYKKEKGID